MKKKTIKIIFFSFLFSFLLFFFLSPLGQAFGQGLETIYPEAGGFKPEAVDVSLPQFVKYIFTFSFIAAGVIAFGSLILAGGRYAFSAGKPEAKKELKKHFLSIFGGIIILLLSYLILTTINPQLTVLRLPPLEEIPVPVLTEIKLPEALEPDPLERIKNIAKASSILSGQIKQEASNLKNQLSQCNCSSGQSMCLCQGGIKGETPTEEKPSIIEKVPELKYVSRLRESNIQPTDIILSSRVSPDILANADLQLPNSQNYIESGLFPDFPLDLNREFDLAKESFGPAYQNTLNQTPVFMLGAGHFREGINKAIDDSINVFGGGYAIELSPVEYEQIAEYKQLIGGAADGLYDAVDGKIIINGSAMADYGLDFKGTLTHEYAHAVDSLMYSTEGLNGGFSSSPKYNKIYESSLQYKQKQFTSGARRFDENWNAIPYGFVSLYAGTNPQEDFADSVRFYSVSGGDPAKISSDPGTQELIQMRFDYLKKQGVVQ